MLTKNHADDDLARNRHVRDPEMCVDYLSYRFDEMDLAASWRVMTKQKKEVVNGLRLENASWRTWAKHKYNLKTVSPETLNWLKDSDVTWLYGPLHTVIKNIEEKDRYAKPKISTTEDTLGLMTRETPSPRPDRPLKSALKKVTTSDLLRRSAVELPSLVNETPAAKASTAADPAAAPSNLSIAEANKQLKVFSPSVVATHRQPKLRFNQNVEQCVALSTAESSTAASPKSARRTRFASIPAEADDASDDNELSDGDDNDNDDDDDDDDVLGHPSSIKKIAPTVLKTSSQSEQETDDVSSLSSSSQSSFRVERSAGWAVEHDEHAGEEGSSSEDEEIEIRPRRRQQQQQQQQRSTSPQAIQWVGQSCVYNHQPTEDEDEYGFDDDDDDDDGWDTHDEGNQAPSPPIPPAAPTSAHAPPTPTMNHFLPPPGHQGFGKALPVSEPCTIDASEPSLSRATNTVVDIQQQQQGNASQPSSSILSNFTQWASSYLWSKPSSSQQQ